MKDSRIPNAANFIAAPIILLLLYSAYSNTFNSPPVLDDFHSFVEDPLLRVGGWSTETLRSLGQTKFGRGRWIPVITFAFDIWFGKGDLLYLHLTNFLIHVLCYFAAILLVYAIIKTVQEQQGRYKTTGPTMAMAIMVAGVWALHPLQTNAVTYIVQRMASLVSLFTFLSVALYILARRASVRKSSFHWTAIACYLLCILTTGMAFLSKENSAIIPFLILCTEWWLFSPHLPVHAFQLLKRHKIFAAGLTLSILALSTYTFMVRIIPSYSNRHFTLLERLMTESRVLIDYFSLLLWPSPGRLSLEHDIEVSTSLFTPPTTIISIMVLAFVGWWMLRYRRRYPLFTYGLMWFFLNMAIESSFLSLELVFEHRMYLPSLGLILSLSVLLQHTAGRCLKQLSQKELVVGAWCVTAILAAGLTLATYERNEAWQDPVTLGRDNVAKAPQNPRSHANLALALWRQGEYQEAIAQAHTAIGLGKENYEEYAVATNTIVMAYSSLNQQQTAIEVGSRLLEEKPEKLKVDALPIVSLNLSVAHLTLQQYGAALDRVEEALAFIQRYPGSFGDSTLRTVALRHLQRIVDGAGKTGTDLDGDGTADPGESDPLTWIARHLLSLEDVVTARMLLTQMAASGSASTEVRQLLGRLDDEDRRNRLQDERKSFTTRYVQHPWSPFDASMALSFLIQKKWAKWNLNGMGEALVDYALEWRPESADAHLLKAWYVFNRGDTEGAITAGKRALSLDHDYARGWLGLGYFLAKAERTDEAVTAFRRTLELYPGIEQKAIILQLIGSLEQGDEKHHYKDSPEDKMADTHAQQSGSPINPS